MAARKLSICPEISQPLDIVFKVSKIRVSGGVYFQLVCCDFLPAHLSETPEASPVQSNARNPD